MLLPPSPPPTPPPGPPPLQELYVSLCLQYDQLRSANAAVKAFGLREVRREVFEVKVGGLLAARAWSNHSTSLFIFDL